MNNLIAATTNDSSLQFAQPVWMLVGLLVCAGVVALFVRFDRRRDADLAKLIHPRFRQRLTEGFSPRLRNLKRGLWVLAVWLAFVAIARPQKGYEWHEVKRRGIDILFAVDTSRSMLAEDLSPNRLERARLGILDFVARLESDRIGLIPFAGSAFALCPLTLDYDAFRESLDALDTDLIPRQGTDLASAIKEAERLFDEHGNNHRVLVLLTDGEDLQGDVIEAAKKAADNGMAIYTVGVGSPEGGTIPVRYRNGRTDFVRDQSGKIVRTTLDESTLKKIAEATNALYVPLGRGAEGLTTIYQERLRLVPKSEMDQRMERIPLERFEWPLGAAIALFLLEFLIGDRRRVKRSRERVSATSTAKSVARTTAMVGFGLMLVGIQEIRAAEDPRAIYNQGTEAYLAGDFGKAAEALKNSLRTQDLTLQQHAYYNLGNTLYRTGQGTLEKDPEATIKAWESAIKAYDDALALDAADEDAKYNKALVERKLEELKKQQQDQKDQKDGDQKDGDQKEGDQKEGDQKEGDQKEGDQKEGDQKEGDQKEGDQKEGDQKEGDQKEGDQKEGDQKEGDQKEGDQKEGDQKEGDQKEGDQKEGDQKEGDQKEGEGSGEKQDEKEESADGKKREDGKDSAKPEKSENEGESGQQGEQPEGEDQQDGETQGAVGNERGEKQEMTPEEARQLLEALRDDERTVIPVPQHPRSRLARPDNTTKGKTW